MSGGPAKVFPVVAVVTDEVCDLAEGLVRDGVLEGHGEDSRFWRWMERDVCEVFLFVLACVVVFVWFVCGAKQVRSRIFVVSVIVLTWRNRRLPSPPQINSSVL